jgi:hypothetical protein
LALPPHAQLRVVDLHQRPLQLNGLGHFFSTTRSKAKWP